MSNGNAERTLILVKPDGVRRGLIGEIVGRFERKGFALRGLKLIRLSREQAERHYAVHKERPFFKDLIEFITGGPLVAMVIEGADVIAISRKMMGATKPLDAECGSVRGDFANQTQENLVHGSDSPESAAFEIPIYFDEAEFV